MTAIPQLPIAEPDLKVYRTGVSRFCGHFNELHGLRTEIKLRSGTSFGFHISVTNRDRWFETTYVWNNGRSFFLVDIMDDFLGYMSIDRRHTIISLNPWYQSFLYEHSNITAGISEKAHYTLHDPSYAPIFADYLDEEGGRHGKIPHQDAFCSMLRSEHFRPGMFFVNMLARDFDFAFERSEWAKLRRDYAVNKVGDVAYITTDYIGTGTFDAPDRPSGMYRFDGNNWVFLQTWSQLISTATRIGIKLAVGEMLKPFAVSLVYLTPNSSNYFQKSLFFVLTLRWLSV